MREIRGFHEPLAEIAGRAETDKLVVHPSLIALARPKRESVLRVSRFKGLVRGVSAPRNAAQTPRHARVPPHKRVPLNRGLEGSSSRAEHARGNAA